MAPEHVSDAVLSVMGKPRNLVYQRFSERYARINEQLDMKQYLVPYLMSSHPGSTLDEAIELAEYCRDLGYMPEQVQDFYPTPSTMSTAMYFTGVDPRTMQPVYVPKSPHEKALQRALIQYRDPKNRELVFGGAAACGTHGSGGIRPEVPAAPAGARCPRGQGRRREEACVEREERPSGQARAEGGQAGCEAGQTRGQAGLEAGGEGAPDGGRAVRRGFSGEK